MSVSFFIQSVVAKIIGLFFACLISFSIFVQFVKGPIKFIKLNVLKLKKRNVMPPCLNDPSLGNHDFVHLEDIRLHYVASGDEGKPLMLFLHGFPEFWYSWRFQIREFRKDYSIQKIKRALATILVTKNVSWLPMTGAGLWRGISRQTTQSWWRNSSFATVPTLPSSLSTCAQTSHSLKSHGT
ncbi:EPHX4-like protein [Mya arenaria]|uniref:EPHX4-like protein n=1 Tax=Mya arenaria TaxID=6604 RepID=A0ABY7DPI9_MYAAR|nr:EPHX4-like protein [Mya arenaria]